MQKIEDEIRIQFGFGIGVGDLLAIYSLVNAPWLNSQQVSRTYMKPARRQTPF